MKYLLVVCIAILGCTYNRKITNTFFVSERNPTHSIKFFDSTFTYKVIGDLMNVHTEGIWKIDGKRIILKSYPSFMKGYCEVLDTAVGCETGFRCLYLFTNDNVPLVNATVYYGK